MVSYHLPSQSVIVDSQINVASNVPVYAQKIDTVDKTTMYIGEALPGTNTSASLWRIKKVSFYGDDVVILWASGNSDFNKVWNNHLSYSYM